MPIQRLKSDSTALLVIDVQERLLHTIHGHERLVHHCGILCRAAPLLGVPTVVTEQYVRGLGHTVPALAQAFAPGTPVFEKTRFSALTPEVRQHLTATRCSSVLVCGIEAHVCVLQTVLDLCASGWGVFFATDAISAGQPDQIEPAFRRMERAGALPTGVLSALYELMGDAQHPSFREVLPLAKSVQMNPTLRA